MFPQIRLTDNANAYLNFFSPPHENDTCVLGSARGHPTQKTKCRSGLTKWFRTT